MKKTIIILMVAIATQTLGQTADPYAEFKAQKKSIALSTGITMKYIETGRAEGTPLILLHGFTDTGRSFQLMIAELLRIRQDLRIIAPDLRGHGQSSLPSDSACAAAPEQCFTMAAFASDIIALMDAKKISQAHVVGHSMGSAVAQQLTLDHAERVKSLVLIGTFVEGIYSTGIQDFLKAGLLEGTWKPTLEAKTGFRWPEDAYRITASDMGSEVTTFLKKNWVYEIATPEAYLQAIFEETIQTPLGTWIGVIMALSTFDNSKALENLRVPTLVLWPTQDMFFPAPDQEKVKTALSKAARRQGIPIMYKTYGKIPLPVSGYQANDLGHNLQWAAPQAVAADVSSFIQTGFPLANISFLSPDNTEQVLTEEGKANLIVWGREKAQR